MYAQKYIRESVAYLPRYPRYHRAIFQTAMGVVDTVMAGAVNATEMSAVAVGTSIWLLTILLGQVY